VHNQMTNCDANHCHNEVQSVHRPHKDSTNPKTAFKPYSYFMCK